MNNDSINTANLTVLGEGLLQNAIPYQVVLLGPEHLDHIHALHAATIASLKPGEKVYMLPKSRGYLDHHLHKGGGNGAIGIVSGGQLVAQILVYHPSASDIDGILAQPPAGVAAEEITVLGGACVAPGYRGNGLMNLLVNNWLDYSAGCGRTHAVADVDVHNTASWAAFIRGGLSLESLMIDPRDGGTIYTAHEQVDKARILRLTPEFNRHSGAAGFEVPGADTSRQKQLMESGYNAVAWDRHRQILLLKQLRPAPP
jgi:RimJ/RimL family protein N-acetyltransferase